MNRRDLLSKVAILMGGALSAPTLMAMNTIGKKPALTTGFADFSMTDTQRKIVAEVAEHIIPKTTTAGAKDAGVPAYIELMLKDCYKQLERDSFLEGVTNLEQSNFLGLSPADQVAMLKKVEAETNQLMKTYNVKAVKVGDNVDKESMDAKKKGVPFWRLMKEMTLTGYFTSEAGIKASFVYEEVPGKFEATKLKPGQKAFAY
jgi:Gluconate 2-dehydrogenase subunit 3